MPKFRVAPLWPTIREFIEHAVADGCEVRIVDGVRCLCRDQGGITILVAIPVSDDNYIRLTPTSADSNYRTLLLIEDSEC